MERENALKALFGDWTAREPMIASCLSGMMGTVFMDTGVLKRGGESASVPECAMAVLGDFGFLAGAPSEAFLRECVLRGVPLPWLLIPQCGAWGAAMESVFGSRLRKTERYATKKEPGVFNPERLFRMAEALPEGVRLCMIDEALYEACKREAFSADFAAQYESYESFRRMGLGVLAIGNGGILAGASSYASFPGGIELEVDTREDCRRQGLASACAARLILECLSRGLYPSWDAHTRISLRLSEKLGYRFAYAYEAYMLSADCGREE